MARGFLVSLVLIFLTVSTTQAMTYGNYTILSLYTQPGCPDGSGPTSLTPTNTVGNCTNLNGTYGLEVAQLGTGCIVQFFQKKDCPPDSFPKQPFPDACDGYGGFLIESVSLVNCELALPEPSSTATTSSTASPTTTSNASSGTSPSSTSSNDKHLSADKIVGIVVGICLVIAALVTIACGGIGHFLTWLGLKQKKDTSDTERLAGNNQMTGTYDRSGNRVGRDFYSGPTIINNYARERDTITG